MSLLENSSKAPIICVHVTCNILVGLAINLWKQARPFQLHNSRFVSQLIVCWVKFLSFNISKVLLAYSDHLSQLTRLWYLSHRRPAKAQTSPHTWSMEVDEGSNQKSDILPHWMAAHARLKNELTEDKKYHLRNKFDFSEDHGSMNAMGHVQSKWWAEGRHLLCTCPIGFILPWPSEKWNSSYIYFRNNFHQLKSI